MSSSRLRVAGSGSSVTPCWRAHRKHGETADMAEAASRLAVLCSRLLLGGDMPQASSSFASLCDRLLESVQSERTALVVNSILVPLLSLLLAAAWGLLLPQLLFSTPAPSESPELEQAVAESRSEPGQAAAEEPEPLLTPTPPADGKPPEVLLAHTPDSFVAVVRERLGCRTQLPRKVYCAYFRSGVPTVTRQHPNPNPNLSRNPSSSPNPSPSPDPHPNHRDQGGPEC